MSPAFANQKKDILDFESNAVGAKSENRVGIIKWTSLYLDKVPKKSMQPYQEYIKLFIIIYMKKNQAVCKLFELGS